MPTLEQITQVSTFCKVVEMRKNLTEKQSEALLTDLIGFAIFGDACELLDLLIKGDMKKFSEHVDFMLEEGQDIKDSLK